MGASESPNYPQTKTLNTLKGLGIRVKPQTLIPRIGSRGGHRMLLWFRGQGVSHRVAVTGSLLG